jgi:hypothetical protein
MADGGSKDFGGIRVSRTDWPIILIEFPEKRVDDAAFKSMLANNEALLAEARSRGEKLFFVSDLTHMRELTPASQRKATAQWVARTFELGRAASLGAAHVTPSTILRGLFTAVFWVNPPPTPAVFVATRAEAMLRAAEAFEAAGRPLPSRLQVSRTSRRAPSSP